jgi:3-phytase
VATVVDINRLGHIKGEVGGLAILNGGGQGNYLVAANADVGDYNVYDRNADDRFLGAFRIQAERRGRAAGSVRPVRPARAGRRGPAGRRPAGHRRPQGRGQHHRSLSWKDVAAALNVSPGADAPTVAPSKLALVTATMETQPVEHGGDAADDPAIYVHPTDPAKSAIIATDKKGGMLVYDLSGKLLQYPARRQDEQCRPAPRLQAGRQERHPGHGQRPHPQGHRDLHDRSRHPPADQRRRRRPGHRPVGPLRPVHVPQPQGRDLRLHQRSRRPGPPVEAGRHPAGKVRAEPVRDLKFDTQTEGCVADDETGALYVAEEDVALWKLGAEPATGRPAPRPSPASPTTPP